MTSRGPGKSDFDCSGAYFGDFLHDRRSIKRDTIWRPNNTLVIPYAETGERLQTDANAILEIFKPGQRPTAR